MIGNHARECGFYISKSYKKIEIASSSNCSSNSSHEVELLALEFSLKVVVDRGIITTTVFTDSVGFQRALINTNNVTAWRLNTDQVNIEVIPREWNTLADKFAMHGRSRHGISLFHQGLNLPRWLMKSFQRTIIVSCNLKFSSILVLPVVFFFS